MIVSSPLSDYATSVCILVDNRAAAEGVHDAEDPIEAVQGAHSTASRLSKRLYTKRESRGHQYTLPSVAERDPQARPKAAR